MSYRYMRVYFFFSSRRRHTRCGRDWSSDVCSSDLEPGPEQPSIERRHREEQRRTEARGDLGDGVGLGPTGAQICLRADEERDEQRVAERVREEQLRGREDAIGRVGAQHVAAIVPAGKKIAMQMHGGLG